MSAAALPWRSVNDDGELLDAWRAGDDQAGRRLVERHYPTIERFFFNKAGESAPDLIQRTFVRVLEARTRVRADANLRAYLLGIARNVLYEHYRTTRKDFGQLDFASHSAIDIAPTPSSQLAESRQAQLLLRALRSIPIDYQVVLELYYWEDMRSREVAAVLDLPEGTARSRIRRARQLLEAKLETLASSPLELRSTATNLEHWAAHLKQRIDDPDAS
ncbi:MAG: sigma-70 family RNA polymerase sigma factor [Deltaproteobacteria bacterium]|nr:sigma-70 family RNA polymerase sigma factor [Deltaproteobacteria bacterium]